MSNLSTDALKIFLADIYALSIKAHNFHWNVTGPQFYSLHILFENQYKSLLETADIIAEQIRIHGDFVPCGLKVFANTTSLEDPLKKIDADTMLCDLIHDIEMLADKAHKIIERCFQNDDSATGDILIQRLHVHENQIWVMRAMRKYNTTPEPYKKTRHI